MDKITLDQYIKNPSGARTRITGEEEVARNVYTDKYNKLMLKVANNINYVLFKKDQERYIIYLKIPSENTPKLFYDVVLDFRTTEDVKKRIGNLNGYYVRFFSNDPNFTFTYAYVFNKRGLIIPELKSKLSTKSLKEKPKTTNPNKMVGYVKSIYFAYLFIKSRGLDNKLMWINAADISRFEGFINRWVMNSENKVIQAQSLSKLSKDIKYGNVHIANPENEGEISDKVNRYTSRTKSIKHTKIVERDNKRRSSKTVKYVNKHY